MRWKPLVAALAAGCGCTLGAGEYAGKRCLTANDCPEPYVCAQARPGQGRTCELLRLPVLSDAGSVPIGPTYDYCVNAKPILDKSCVQQCHGTATTGSGRSDFRLDVYPDQGSVLGAFKRAERIKARTADKSMPPPTSPDQPTDEERKILVDWVNAGAPECLDGGT